MGAATVEGVVENGQIRLPAAVRLPERTKVYVVIPDVEVQTVAYIGSPRLVHPEQAVDFIKEVIKESSDGDL
jgi:hypothetical protein